MAYSAPAGNAVDLSLAELSYVAPTSGAILLELSLSIVLTDSINEITTAFEAQQCNFRPLYFNFKKASYSIFPGNALWANFQPIVNYDASDILLAVEHSQCFINNEFVYTESCSAQDSCQAFTALNFKFNSATTYLTPPSSNISFDFGAVTSNITIDVFDAIANCQILCNTNSNSIESVTAQDSTQAARTLGFTITDVAAPSGFSDAIILASGITQEVLTASNDAQCSLFTVATTSESSDASDVQNLTFNWIATILESVIASDNDFAVLLANAMASETITPTEIQHSVLWLFGQSNELIQAQEYQNASATLRATLMELNTIQDLTRDNYPYFSIEKLPADMNRIGINRIMEKPMTDRIFRSSP